MGLDLSRMLRYMIIDYLAKETTLLADYMLVGHYGSIERATSIFWPSLTYFCISKAVSEVIPQQLWHDHQIVVERIDTTSDRACATQALKVMPSGAGG